MSLSFGGYNSQFAVAGQVDNVDKLLEKDVNYEGWLRDCLWRGKEYRWRIGVLEFCFALWLFFWPSLDKSLSGFIAGNVYKLYMHTEIGYILQLPNTCLMIP